MRILLAGDELGFVACAATALRRAAHEVVVARSVCEALVAAAGAPALIVLDLALGGIALLARLRDAAPTVPVLVLGSLDDADFLAASAVGHVHCLLKPFVIEELVTAAAIFASRAAGARG